MKIRQAQIGDVAELCLILNEIIDIGGTTAYELPLSEEEFKLHFLTGKDCLSCVLIEDESGCPLGFQGLSLSSHCSSDYADIATFARVTGKVKGVGTKLFAETQKLGIQLGYKFINATIRADNTQGLSYYKKLGFIDYKIDKAVPQSDGTPIDRISKRYDLQQSLA